MNRRKPGNSFQIIDETDEWFNDFDFMAEDDRSDHTGIYHGMSIKTIKI